MKNADVDEIVDQRRILLYSAPVGIDLSNVRIALISDMHCHALRLQGAGRFLCSGALFEVIAANRVRQRFG